MKTSNKDKTHLYNQVDEQFGSLITFSGKDARGFLQGQTTNDVADLKELESQFGALCNPKGRVISLFYLLLKNDVYYMATPTSLCPIIIQRLKMFVFRSDVKIQDVSSQFVLNANFAANKHTKGENPFASFNINPHLSLNITETSAPTVLPESQAPSWPLALISAGIPVIEESTSELFIPQMLNLDALAGISFTKGCYTGQEIIARLHYKGTVKRRMYIFTASEYIPSGTELFIENDVNSVGTVVNCKPSEAGQFSGTVVLKTGVYSQQPIAFKGLNNISLHLPPYSFEIAK